MVHLIVLCKLNENVTQKDLEGMSRSARSQLLKIPEVLAVRSGKRIKPDNEWPYFYSVEIDTMDKLAMFRDDPILIRFIEKVIKPNTWTVQELVYELEPGKDVKYS
jgi:hypothetical protein